MDLGLLSSRWCLSPSRGADCPRRTAGDPATGHGLQTYGSPPVLSKSFCIGIKNFSAVFTLPEKIFFEKILCLTQCYRFEGRGFSQFGQKNKTDLSKLTDRFFAVPKGVQVVTTALIMGVIIKTQALLSPAGARVVTLFVRTLAQTTMCCCPRRGVSCYVMYLGVANIAGKLLSPQGRELLRQKCEKYNADFRHSYNLFVLSSVFLRIHS